MYTTLDVAHMFKKSKVSKYREFVKQLRQREILTDEDVRVLFEVYKYLEQGNHMAAVNTLEWGTDTHVRDVFSRSIFEFDKSVKREDKNGSYL